MMMEEWIMEYDDGERSFGTLGVVMVLVVV